MTKSDSISALAAALAKAQPKIEGATKDKTNPHFKSKYADLASVAEAIAEPLAANGLSYVQVSHDRENAAAIETIILHTSGEWLGCGAVSVPVSKNDAQGFGSALTYARRYSLSAAFGVVPEDDDGNAASKARPIQSAAHRPTDGNGGANARAASEDAFNAMDKGEQEFLRETAANMTALYGENRTPAAYDLFHKLDQEEKLAIWHLFGSKERSAFKAEGESRKEKQAA
jgi:hypothetical protein